MYNVSRRFHKYAVQVGNRYYGRDLDLITQVGHWQSHYAGRRGRRWVTGYCLKLQLEAVIYPRHAHQPGIELERSYIRKLCLRRMSGQRVVALFDRGWRVPPTTEQARRAVAFFMKWTALLEYGPHAIRRGEEPIFLGIGTQPRLEEEIEQPQESSGLRPYSRHPLGKR